MNKKKRTNEQHIIFLIDKIMRVLAADAAENMAQNGYEVIAVCAHRHQITRLNDTFSVRLEYRFRLCVWRALFLRHQCSVP